MRYLATLLFMLAVVPATKLEARVTYSYNFNSQYGVSDNFVYYAPTFITVDKTVSASDLASCFTSQGSCSRVDFSPDFHGQGFAHLAIYDVGIGGIVEESLGEGFYSGSFSVDGVHGNLTVSGSPSAVPEPGQWILMSFGFFGAGIFFRRRLNQPLRREPLTYSPVPFGPDA